jgi:signal transduction histidine kinase
MRVAFRPPLFVLAIALLGLILLLATLQYVWLGRISEAERERLRATLTSRASEFAQDFDRELTRAYLLYQADPPQVAQDTASRFAERYDRWQATSAYPKLLKDFYTVAREPSGGFKLQRFDAATRTLREASWPDTMADWRTRFDDRQRQEGERGLVIRHIAGPIWETVPALIVPTPILFVAGPDEPPSFSPPEISYTVLTIDLSYVRDELLPSLAQRHFRKAGDADEFQVAVIDRAGSGSLVYQSPAGFVPHQAENGDASASLFQVRTQDFSAVAAEVKRFTMFRTTTDIEQRLEERVRRGGRVTVHGPAQMSIVVRQGSASDGRGTAAGLGRPAAPPAPRWQVIVKHPAGSLEAFVASTRRRNLLISTSILGVLAASMTLLIVSTRRSQELARQQLEFVAGVSHELRTPLAVIRSAGDNLAHGVVHDAVQVQRYGDLIRAEGRRLSEMVEQILEFAGIQSGQRGFAQQQVPIGPLVDEVLSSSRALLDDAHVRVEVDIPSDLPPVVGDESALRRVVQNLIGNAIKYGASGGWIGVRARHSGAQVTLAVSDKGIGIASAEQGRIFEPFYRATEVIAGRMQGAGLGLSLVQRIVEGHGGRVSVKSAPGAGSEFIVSLPVAAGDAAEFRTQPGAEPAQSS